jgi:hypothetical protein
MEAILPHGKWSLPLLIGLDAHKVQFIFKYSLTEVKANLFIVKDN